MTPRHGRALSRPAARQALCAMAALMLASLSPYTAQAQGAGPLGGACRDDYRRFCSGVRPGGGAIANCFREHAAELSGQCRAAIGERVASRAQQPEAQPSAPMASETRVLRDIAYGPDPKQRFDIYLPPAPRNAPIILMVHGGAWAIGDKASSAVVANKVAHWLPRGFVFVSINTRLLPQADPMAQAGDVARALAAVQARAAEWGADGGKVVLMGHSAGAHLVTLLAAAPEIAKAAGARATLGTIALDSAALDVPAIMEQRHLPLYDRAFGSDPAAWKRASPLHRLQHGSGPLLLVCSSNRRDSCQQAQTFEAAVRAAGGRAQMLPIALSHGQINASLGADAAYTGKVDAFIAAIGAR